MPETNVQNKKTSKKKTSEAGSSFAVGSHQFPLLNSPSFTYTDKWIEQCQRKPPTSIKEAQQLKNEIEEHLQIVRAMKQHYSEKSRETEQKIGQLQQSQVDRGSVSSKSEPAKIAADQGKISQGNAPSKGSQEKRSQELGVSTIARKSRSTTNIPTDESTVKEQRDLKHEPAPSAPSKKAQRSENFEVVVPPTHIPSKKRSKSKLKNKRRRTAVVDDDDEEYNPNEEEIIYETEETEGEESTAETSEMEEEPSGATPSVGPLTGSMKELMDKKKKKKKLERNRRQQTLPLSPSGSLPSSIPGATATGTVTSTATPPRKKSTPPSKNKKKGAGTGSQHSRRRRKRTDLQADSDLEHGLEDFEEDSTKAFNDISSTHYTSPNLTPQQQFWNYINTYFIPVTANNKKLLKLLEQQQIDASEDDAFQIPSLGRHYSEIWMEEDTKQAMGEDHFLENSSLYGSSTPVSSGNNILSSLSSPAAVSSPFSTRTRGTGTGTGSAGSAGSGGVKLEMMEDEDMNNCSDAEDDDDDEDNAPVLDVENASNAFEKHHLAQRLLCALIEENDSLQGSNTLLSTTQGGKKVKKGRPTKVGKGKYEYGSPHSATALLPPDEGSIQNDLYVPVTEEYSSKNMSSVQERVLGEMKDLGLASKEETISSLQLDNREDDEICAELRALQNELRYTIEITNQRKLDLLAFAQSHFDNERRREKNETEYREAEKKYQSLMKKKKHK